MNVRDIVGDLPAETGWHLTLSWGSHDMFMASFRRDSGGGYRVAHSDDPVTALLEAITGSKEPAEGPPDDSDLLGGP